MEIPLWLQQAAARVGDEFPDMTEAELDQIADIFWEESQQSALDAMPDEEPFTLPYLG